MEVRRNLFDTHKVPILFDTISLQVEVSEGMSKRQKKFKRLA